MATVDNFFSTGTTGLRTASTSPLDMLPGASIPLLLPSAFRLGMSCSVNATRLSLRFHPPCLSLTLALSFQRCGSLPLRSCSSSISPLSPTIPRRPPARTSSLHNPDRTQDSPWPHLYRMHIKPVVWPILAHTPQIGQLDIIHNTRIKGSSIKCRLLHLPASLRPVRLIRFPSRRRRSDVDLECAVVLSDRAVDAQESCIANREGERGICFARGHPSVVFAVLPAWCE